MRSLDGGELAIFTTVLFYRWFLSFNIILNLFHFLRVLVNLFLVLAWLSHFS